ncbi:uroporphyrinogen decarboxylase family protein [Candidatus Latescibacterota bacterium]
MTPRELVINTLEFASPARIPRHMWVLPYATDHHPGMVSRINNEFPDDIVYAPEIYQILPKTAGDPYKIGYYTDEWGCTFENKQKGIIGEVKEPLLGNWNGVDSIKTPDELLSLDIDAVNAFCRNTDRFVLPACFARPFERIQFIRKSENLLCDLAYRPRELFVLIEKVHDFYCKQLELWAGTEVEGLFFMDDWGAQDTLLINPNLWREIFKPLYRDYIDIAHRHGKYAFMHSDGHITDIIPDLIELGLDALNSQLFCMNIDDLGELFRGRLTFWGEIDRQHLLPYGTTEDIVRAVRSVKNAFYSDGGVIAQCEFGPGADPDNVYLVFKTWNEL